MFFFFFFLLGGEADNHLIPGIVNDILESKTSVQKNNQADNNKQLMLMVAGVFVYCEVEHGLFSLAVFRLPLKCKACASTVLQSLC